MGNCTSKPSPGVLDEPEKVTKIVIDHEQSAPGASPDLVPPSQEPDKDVDHGFVAPSTPGNEHVRLELLRALQILDTDREDARFKSVTKLMGTVFNVPIVAVSLVDADTSGLFRVVILGQWFKAAEGLGEVCQTDRDVSFCGHTILPQTPQILIIEDALEDVRFKGNPLVSGPPHIRFYAGAPLVSSANGYRYGSLCVIDIQPHKDFRAEHYNLLAQFAELTVREIEKDKLALLQKMVREQRSLSLSASGSPLGSLRSSTTEDADSVPWGLSRAADCFSEGVMLVDVASPSWQILYTNTAFSTSLGLPRDEAASQGFWDVFGGGSGIGPVSFQEAAEENEPFSMTVALQRIYTQTPKQVTIDFRPAASAQLGTVGVPAQIESNGDSSGGVDGKPSKGPQYYFGIVQTVALRSSMRSGSGIQSPTVSSGDRVQFKHDGSLPLPSSVPAVSKIASTAFTDVRLGPLIGRGAYGRVYRASWNGNTVAVKVMETTEQLMGDGNGSTSRGGSAHGGSRGLFEAMLSSALSHPNVAHTYQYAVRPLQGQQGRGMPARPSAMQPAGAKAAGNTGKQLYEVWLISEFCNRGPLLTAIERGAFLTQPSAHYGQPNLIAVLQTLQEIAAAMHYLHGHDIVHGDLTGGNVLLTSSDKDARGFTSKVVDFGLSRVCGDDGLHTKTMGCAEYMPAELIKGGVLTKASDVYAFGVVIWELYVGKRAWEGLQPGQVLKKVASGETLTFPPQTPHRLRVLGERCLAFDAKARPTFTEVLSEVNAILGDTMNILQQFLTASAGRENGAPPSMVPILAAKNS